MQPALPLKRVSRLRPKKLTPMRMRETVAAFGFLAPYLIVLTVFTISKHRW